MIGPLTECELDRSVIDRFAAVVRAHGERPAVVGQNRTLTYAELSRSIDLLAGVLRSAQTPRKTVPLLLDSGPAFVQAALGAMAADQIYVPLGVRSPEARLREVLEDCGAELLVTDARHADLAQRLASGTRRVVDLDHLPYETPVGEPGRPIDPDAIADIYYTSGSTGRPKGVPHTHRANLHDALVATREFEITHDDRLPLLFSCEFGGVRNPVLWALLNGAALYTYDLLPGWIVHLSTWLGNDRATNVQMVPSIFREFLNSLKEDARFPDLRVVGLVGEAMTKRDVERFRLQFPREAKLVNLYGVTEAGIVSRLPIDSAREISTEIVPIGHPFADMDLLLVDRNQQVLTESGASGEMVVRSRHVSPGYWRRPALTADAFSEEPGTPGVRSYRTGDLGRRLPDGSIMHMGRLDSQVKVRGHRIELLEVESALAACNGVGRAAAVIRKDQYEEDRLIGYVEPLRGHSPAVGTLRTELTTRLPEYMVPSTIMLLETLPLTATGKVDRRSLPEPTPPTGADNQYVAPRTATETRLQTIWRTVLRADHFGIRDSFFELGGDSLSAVRMLVEVERTLGKAVPPGVFFQRPFIENLAAALEEEAPPAHGHGVVVYSADGARPPLFCVDMGNAGIFAHLAGFLAPGQPCYGIQPMGFGGPAPRFTIESIATHLIEQIRRIRPTGPYALCGFCAGGNVAFEMAQQHTSGGAEVVLLALVDSFVNPKSLVPYAITRLTQKFYRREIRPVMRHAHALCGRSPGSWWPYLREARKQARERKAAKALRWNQGRPEQICYEKELLTSMHLLKRATQRACARYKPRPYDGRVILFLGDDTGPDAPGSRDAWGDYARGTFQQHQLSGFHNKLLIGARAKQIATTIREALDACTDGGLNASAPRLR
jgi:amino acid adenylation domain-containing protein